MDINDIIGYTRQHTIVALDVDTYKDGMRLANLIAAYVGYFKVGPASGICDYSQDLLAHTLKESGYKVFYDQKYHDTTTTTSRASLACQKRHWDMFDVSIESGREALRAARANKGTALLFGNTIPTHLTAQDVAEMYDSTRDVLIPRFARIALEEGLDGIVCSVSDLGHLDSHQFNALLKLTPAIRPEGCDHHDQVMTATPAQAIRAGSDFIVLGRAVTAAKDPVSAIALIQDEMIQTLERMLKDERHVRS
ncbi:MAG: orotidine-5'-phosphate decarboxylase [bacterium]|nr:orotidine-5'-phosphate decarboxylase [bacterium]